ncbi:hypothetical protein [Haliangium sp.]|uniref:hypothetical protein n=1 Tax=Haliangium sp. TaxID=2663208 RepID=UPI003D11E389
MASSRSGSKHFVVIAAVVAVGLSAVLYLLTRPPEKAPDPTVAVPAQPAPEPARAGGAFAAVGQGPRPTLPAKTQGRTNQLGQPLDLNGRPIGPPPQARPTIRPLDRNTFPLVPPRIEDADKRAQFKQWWKDELKRRVEIYQRIEPRDEGYPDMADTDKMLDTLYEAGEPRREGETDDQIMARRQDWRTTLRDFTQRFGAPPYTVLTRGGDPQYGEPTAPPIEVSNNPPPTPQPAEPSTESPPGRGPGDPGGSEPMPARGGDSDGAGDGQGGDKQ